VVIDEQEAKWTHITKMPDSVGDVLIQMYEDLSPKCWACCPVIE